MTARFRDVRYGWRSPRGAPWYALTITGVLAVGVGSRIATPSAR